MLSQTSHTEPQTVEDLAEDLIGAPFLDRGRGPVAYDCLGLFLELARRWGVELRDPCTKTSIDRDAYRGFYLHFRRLTPQAPLKPMDLLFLPRGDRQHVQTVLSGRFVLDTTQQVGAHRRELLEATKAPHEAYRLKCRPV